MTHPQSSLSLLLMSTREAWGRARDDRKEERWEISSFPSPLALPSVTRAIQIETAGHESRSCISIASLTMHSKPLSSTDASLCPREAGEKEKESTRGTMGRGKRRIDYCYFYWDTQRESLRMRLGREIQTLNKNTYLESFPPCER